MAQILRNPTLEWDGKTNTYFDPTDDLSSIKQVDVENPRDWRYIYQIKVPNHAYRIPQSLHVSGEGFKLAAGWFPWQAGYQQRVVLQGGQRYILKAMFDQDAPGHLPADAVESLLFVDGDLSADSGWSSVRGGSEKLFVIQPTRDGPVDIQFYARARYGNFEVNFTVHSITLEEVGQDYAPDGFMPVTPFAPGGAPVDPPEPPADNDDEPEPPSTDSPPTQTINVNITIKLESVLDFLALLGNLLAKAA